jgi:hypothetical protein
MFLSEIITPNNAKCVFYYLNENEIRYLFNLDSNFVRLERKSSLFVS